jgi:hypothetical protein
MIILFAAFLIICLGTVKIQSIAAIQKLGIKLNAVLIMLSIGLFALWYFVNANSPPVSMSEHWMMALISLIGFLCMLLSTVAALKNLSGVQSWVAALLSIGMALVHFLDIVVSVPVS